MFGRSLMNSFKRKEGFRVSLLILGSLGKLARMRNLAIAYCTGRDEACTFQRSCFLDFQILFFSLSVKEFRKF